MEFYDASGTTPQAPRSDDLLRRMQAEDSERRLLALFDDIDEMIDEGRDHDREQGVDPGILARLDAIAGADDAPFELRELHRRVEGGSLTWQQLWLAPEEEPGGDQLINLAMKAEGAELAALVAATEDASPPGSGEPPPSGGQILGR